MFIPTRAIALLICVFAASSFAFADGYMLRGPAPKAGDTIRVESIVEMKDGTMDINAGGMRLAGKMDMSMRSIIETTILEVEDVTITKVRIRHVEETQEQTVEMMGQRSTNKDEAPLHGQTIVGTLSDDSWSFELENGSPNAAQRARLAELNRSYKFDDRHAVYPDRKIAIGESWEVDAADMDAQFSGTDRPEGKVTLTLDKVEEVDGEKLAHLTVTMDLEAAMTAEGPGDGKMTMKATGPVIRSLKTFVDKSSKLTGTMQMRMAEGDDMEMNMNGPMTFAGKESRP